MLVGIVVEGEADRWADGVVDSLVGPPVVAVL